MFRGRTTPCEYVGLVDTRVARRTAQQAAGRSDKRLTTPVLDIARLLAQLHEVGARRPAPEDRLGEFAVQVTAAARLHGPGHFAQFAGLGNELARAGRILSLASHRTRLPAERHANRRMPPVK